MIIFDRPTFNEEHMGRKLLLTIFAITLFFGTTFSQFADPAYSVVPVETHTGMVGTTDLSGFTTYRIYVHVDSDDYVLSAIYANFVDAVVFSFDAECDIFQHPQGEFIGANISCALQEFEPALAYDSWFTIGNECSGDPGNVTPAYNQPPQAQVLEDFNEDGGIGPGFLDIDDFAIFTTNDQPNAQPFQDTDGVWKVLVGQITTCGNFDFCFGVDLIDITQTGVTHENYICSSSPCEDSPIELEVNGFNLSCFEDESGSIEVDTTSEGNGGITHDLFLFESGEDSLLVEGNETGDFSGLSAGEYFVVTTDEVGCMNYSDTLTITQPDELLLDVTQDSGVDCFGEETAGFTAEASGGTEPYLFNFDDGEGFGSESTVTDLPCGQYEIVVEDDNGCSATQLETVDCPEEVIIDLTVEPISCFEACDASITGTVSGGTGELSYEWTGCQGFTSTDLELSDLCACDSYQLVVTDTLGCEATASFEITEPLELTTMPVVDSVDCFGENSGAINIIAQGGTGVVDTELEDLEGNPVDGSALEAGTYISTTSDQQGCTVIDTLEVFEPSELMLNILDTTNVTCFEYSDGLISVEGSGGIPGQDGYQYAITPDPNDPSEGPLFDSLPANQYTVSVLDSAGCIASVEVEIEQPDGIELTFETEQVTCNGDSDGTLNIIAEGGTSPINYEIESDEDLFGQIDDGFFDDLNAATYDVTVTDSNGCARFDSVMVAEPDTLMAEVLATTDITCAGDCSGSVLLDITGGNPGYDILWNGDSLQMSDELCAGPNQVAITDSLGCTTSLEIIMNEPPPIQFLIDTVSATCTGMNDGSASVNVIGGTGEVNIDLGGIDLDNLSEGNYIVTAVDSFGCVVQDTIMVSSTYDSNLTLEVFTSPVTCWNEADGTATAAVSGEQGEITYQWNDPENQTTSTAVGLEEETYTVTVTDELGCTLTSSGEVEPTEGCFFIATAITPNGDGINDEWVIGGLEYFPNSLVQVYNRWGQLMFESRGYPTRWDGRFNGNRLPIADYYYVITFEESGLETLTGTVTIKY